MPLSITFIVHVQSISVRPLCFFSPKYLTFSVPLMPSYLILFKERLNTSPSCAIVSTPHNITGLTSVLRSTSLSSSAIKCPLFLFVLLVTQLWTVYADNSKQNCSYCAKRRCRRRLRYIAHNHQVFYETQALSCSCSKAICIGIRM